MASTTSVPGGKQPCSGSLWPPGRAPRPTADGIVCVLQNRPASADSRVRFTAVAVDAGARVAAGDERGALVVVDAARNRFERVATLDARATALAWVGDRVACAVCHPRAPRLVAVDAATGTLSEVAAAHAPGTSIATLDARDRLVVTAARDAARFWTLDGDWLRQSAFEGAGAEVAAAAVGTDGNAVVLDRDGVVHLVDPSSGQATAQLSPQHGEAPSRGVWCCVAALPGGAVVAGGPLLCEWAPGGAFERLSSSSGPHVYPKIGPKPRPASISDAITQMDHNAVVLFTIDRLARSPRTTVRRRSTRKAPDPRVAATPPPRWTIKPLFYSRSTDLPVLRGRRCVRGALNWPQTGEL